MKGDPALYHEGQSLPPHVATRVREHHNNPLKTLGLKNLGKIFLLFSKPKRT